MTYMAIFAGIVILIGIVFIGSTVRGARKEKSHATVNTPPPETVYQPGPSARSNEGDAAYRDALRTFAKGQALGRAENRRRPSLSDDAYREALRNVKKEKSSTSKSNDS